MILTLGEADAWVASQRAAGRTIGFACGAFDLLHPGHIQYLEKARALCDCLLVAVNSDASVQRYKSPLRPIHPEAHRMYLLTALRSVDAVVLMEDDRPLRLLERWMPDFYLKGGDYGGASSLRSGEFVRSYGGAVHVIPSDFATSTSQLIERIATVAAHTEPERLAPASPRGLVLLDRDGTLIRDVPFLHEPEKVELLPGVGEGLKRLQDAGFRLVIASNQQGIGLGYFSTQDFIAVNQRLFHELAPYGVLISRIYHCPHTAPDNCACRKPAAGMLDRAMRDFAVTPAQTFFIGDLPSDLQAGLAAGCQTILCGLHPAGFTGAVDRILLFSRGEKLVERHDDLRL